MADTTAIVTIRDGSTKSTVISRVEELGFVVADTMPNSDSNFRINCAETDMPTIENEADVDDIVSQIQLDKLQIRRAYDLVPFDQTINPDTSSTPNGSAHNWGLARCSQASNRP